MESPTTPLLATRVDPGEGWRLRGHSQMRQRTHFEDISGDATRGLACGWASWLGSRVDEKRFAQLAAREQGFTEEDGVAAKEILGLPADGFEVRFMNLASFARVYGIGLRELAR